MTKTPIHRRDLVTALPLIKIMPPEMRVLFREWINEDPNRRLLGKKEYLPAFQNWYTQREAISKSWADYSEFAEGSPRHLNLNPRISRKVQSIPEKSSILDIGCGTGEEVIPFLKKAQTYVGLDTSAYCLSRLKDKYHLQNISLGEIKPGERKFTCFGALPSALPIYQAQGFDEVLCNMTLNHVHDLQTSLDSIFSLLKPGGNYFISTFDADKISRANIPELAGNPRIVYHPTNTIFNILKSYSQQVRTEQNGGIFKIFEGKAR
ncbi:MAG: class I SAM-dependent methyltransferase [Nanoarchaeota archaeon]|nr:class I SAM-dependent methyltransferase [Nanoarchaeota archaeon]